jgi:hypothetical protein
MTIPTILFIIAIVLAAVDLMRTRGQALTSWAVVAIAVGLLWGQLG